MPVIGHAFVGIATADAARDVADRGQRGGAPLGLLGADLRPPGLLARPPRRSRPRPHWVATARVLGHSLLFAGVVGPLVALLLSGLGLPFRRRPRLVARVRSSPTTRSTSPRPRIASPSGLSRDRPMGLGWELVPRATWVEAAVYGGAAGARRARPPLGAWSRRSERDPREGGHSRPGASPGPADGRRLPDPGCARRQGTRLRRCGGSPSPERVQPVPRAPGRGRALAGDVVPGSHRLPARGGLRRPRQPARAEEAYLRSYRAEPGYFWLVADLAAFYAGTDRSLEERRRLVDPLLARLKDEFRDEPGLPEALGRIERRLAKGASASPPPGEVP